MEETELGREFSTSCNQMFAKLPELSDEQIAWYNFVLAADRQYNAGRFNYDDLVLPNDPNLPIKFMCKRHGPFMQNQIDHLDGLGCPKCLPKIRTTEDFIRRAKEKFGDKFDYSLTELTSSKNKLDIVCRKHGRYSTFAHNHLVGYNCPKCRIENITSNTEEFIEKALKTHGYRYDYSKAVYSTAMEKIEIVCRNPEHGSFWVTPSSHLSGSNCPKCNSSFGETAIRRILLKHSVEHSEQYKLPEIQNRYKYDFYIPSKNLLIEFQGLQHYQDIKMFAVRMSLEERQARDRIKLDIARTLKYSIEYIDYDKFVESSTEEFEELVMSVINKYKDAKS